MNKLLLALLLSPFFSILSAQNAIEIGKAQGNNYIITADTTLLRKAIQQTLADGTQIQSMHIESINQGHYLIAKGIQRNYFKTIAIELQYNINTRTYSAIDGMGHKTCASAACEACTPFKENGKIIGCRCSEVKSVSNECTFKVEQVSMFYNQLKRYIKMKS